MRTKTFATMAGLASLILFGCATMPDKSELQRVDGESLRNALIGNTYTRTANWGRYAEYYEADGTGHGKAWGNSWAQRATSTYEISPDGEICGVYKGDPDWAGGKEHCMVIYMDAEGEYFMEITKDEYKPHRVGDLNEVEIKPGDEYGLGG